MGGTFSFYLRYFFAFHSIPKRSSIEDKAKFYRRSIEHLSKTYRTPIEDLSKTYRTSIEDLSKTYRRPIEDLSKTYRRPIEESMCQLFYPPPYGLSDAPKNGHIAMYLLFDKWFFGEEFFKKVRSIRDGAIHVITLLRNKTTGFIMGEKRISAKMLIQK